MRERLLGEHWPETRRIALNAIGILSVQPERYTVK